MRLLTTFCLLAFSSIVGAMEYDQTLDLQVRFDDRSGQSHRNQYRVRFYPSMYLDAQKNWSVHAFAVTGDEFSSSHNTYDSDTTDYFYVRRAYLRHESGYGKTEVGIIPTYKGRVSATGLSKDGWIGGVRHVQRIGQTSALEVVVGELNEFDASKALFVPDEVDYIEVEFSARMGQRHSYEFSAERITEGDYLRAEYRYQYSGDNTLFLEYVRRVDEQNDKVVVGVSGTLTTESELDYYLYYAYVSDNFGTRAELTEDFLGTGHGVSAEISGQVANYKSMKWFARVDSIDSHHRLLSGLAFKF